MHRTTRHRLFLSTWLILALLLVACGGTGSAPAAAPAAKDSGSAAKPAPAPPAQRAPDAAAKKGAPVTLRLGMLPIIDCLPFWVAEARGYFQAAGLDVKLETFRSADERDLALSAGQLDGVLSDLVASVTLRASGSKVKIVSLSLGATPAEGRFAILAAPKSDVTRLEQLKGEPVAISNNSVIHYVTDELLKEAGFTPDQIKTTSIPQIPVRFEALMSGQIKAATLPDPLLALAELQGARVLADDAKASRNLSQSVILVTEAVLQAKAAALQQMFVAYNQAIADIAKDPGSFRPVLVQKANLPKPIETTFNVTPFSPAQLPREADIQRVVKWLVDRKVIKQEVAYADMVTGSALPPAR